MSNVAHQPADTRPALILFGHDPAHSPYAGWFTGDELQAAERASGALGFVALRITHVDEQALALRLPRGHLGHDGQVQVPMLSPELFQTLQVLVLGIRLVRVRPTPSTAAPPLQPASSVLLVG